MPRQSDCTPSLHGVTVEVQAVTIAFLSLTRSSVWHEAQAVLRGLQHSTAPLKAEPPASGAWARTTSANETRGRGNLQESLAWTEYTRLAGQRKRGDA